MFHCLPPFAACLLDLRWSDNRTTDGTANNHGGSPPFLKVWQLVPNKMYKKIFSSAFRAIFFGGVHYLIGHLRGSHLGSHLCFRWVRPEAVSGEGGLQPVSPTHHPQVQEWRRLGMNSNHPEASKNGHAFQRHVGRHVGHGDKRGPHAIDHFGVVGQRVLPLPFGPLLPWPLSGPTGATVADLSILSLAVNEHAEYLARRLSHCHELAWVQKQRAHKINRHVDRICTGCHPWSLSHCTHLPLNGTLVPSEQ